MEDEVYKFIDDFLGKFKGKEPQAFGKLFLDPLGKAAIQIMIENKLIVYSGELTATKLVNISIPGHKVLHHPGGIRGYLGVLSKKEEERESLELEKLKGDVEKLKYDILISKDTPSNNRKNRVLAIISIIIAFGALLISLIALLNNLK
ncbi:MAG TPA: hypothetical protein VIM89_03435 [Mucilaginibacter sp.]